MSAKSDAGASKQARDQRPVSAPAPPTTSGTTSKSAARTIAWLNEAVDDVVLRRECTMRLQRLKRDRAVAMRQREALEVRCDELQDAARQAAGGANSKAASAKDRDLHEAMEHLETADEEVEFKGRAIHEAVAELSRQAALRMNHVMPPQDVCLRSLCAPSRRPSC